MKTYIYLSDIHANYSVLRHILTLDEMNDANCEFRFGGDYIDGVTLNKDDTINTLRLIKSLCDSGKAKAILGNHDNFLKETISNPMKPNSWYYNGEKSTLKNLGLWMSHPIQLRYDLQEVLGDVVDWLYTLPHILEDGDNIMVHAGLELNRPLSEQDEDYMLWIRTPYHEYSGEVHIDYHNKTVISGHTPNQVLCGTPNIISDKVHNTTRYFIDGGSNSGAKDGNISLLKLDEKGNKLWEGYLTSDGVVIR